MIFLTYLITRRQIDGLLFPVGKICRTGKSTIFNLIAGMAADKLVSFDAYPPRIEQMGTHTCL